MAKNEDEVLPRRVVVTGVGLLSSVGNGTHECWAAVRGGRNGIGPITQFDASDFNCRIAGEVKNFDPLDYVDKKDVKKMGRFIQFAMAASEFAVKDAQLTTETGDPERLGVYIGSGIGGFEVIEREHKILLERGPSRISPFFIPSCIVNLASGYVSIKYNAQGPNSATATACTTSAHSIGDSFRLIQHGDADVMICGGSEACVTPMGIGGFAAMRALSTRNDHPEKASRPWDRERDGFIVGEGSGILILEAFEHAKKRDARILAEIVGYGMSADAHHITSPPENGDGGYRVMRNAMRDASIEPLQVQYINAHGTSTGLGDKAETCAIKRAFGDHA
ncbi:MAG: beta-ketoacyl-ACP synthase II, partial [Acidobacteriaceae bacterium]|nr:beta-ketoacyl-ACP synthase II [Acidobacteriaceae bacterium]